MIRRIETYQDVMAAVKLSREFASFVDALVFGDQDWHINMQKHELVADVLKSHSDNSSCKKALNFDELEYEDLYVIAQYLKDEIKDIWSPSYKECVEYELENGSFDDYWMDEINGDVFILEQDYCSKTDRTYLARTEIVDDLDRHYVGDVEMVGWYWGSPDDVTTIQYYDRNR